jgi:hypothetical protein
MMRFIGSSAADAEVMLKLGRELDEAQRRRFERLDFYLALKGRHIKELNIMRSRLEKSPIGGTMSSSSLDSDATFHMPTSLESNWISAPDCDDVEYSSLLELSDSEMSDSLFLDVSEEEDHTKPS